MRREQKTQYRYAFTLIEILVVLVIMGFLTTMIAPKLAGIVGFSEESIDDMNLKELSKIVTDFHLQNERVPKNMVNLVHDNNNTDTYELLNIHDTPGEVADLSEEFEMRLLPTLHKLNEYEVKELRRLGIRKVRNYRHTFSGGAQEYNTIEEIKNGSTVLMVGCGSDDNSSNVTWSESQEGSITDDGAGDIDYDPYTSKAPDTVSGTTYACISSAPYLGRIILGIDDENELVTKGYLDRAGTSPKETRQNEINWLHYGILLPRLEATVARMDKTTLTLRKYDNEVDEGYGNETIEMTKQALSDIVVVSPQGLIAKDKNFKYGVQVE